MTTPCTPHGNTGNQHAAKPESARASAQINIRCHPKDRARWQEVAKAQGKTTTEWMVKTLNHCSSQEYLEAEDLAARMARHYFQDDY